MRYGDRHLRGGIACVLEIAFHMAVRNTYPRYDDGSARAAEKHDLDCYCHHHDWRNLPVGHVHHRGDHFCHSGSREALCHHRIALICTVDVRHAHLHVLLIGNGEIATLISSVILTLIDPYLQMDIYSLRAGPVLGNLRFVVVFHIWRSGRRSILVQRYIYTHPNTSAGLCCQRWPCKRNDSNP